MSEKITIEITSEAMEFLNDAAKSLTEGAGEAISAEMVAKAIIEAEAATSALETN